ncbi:MAG: nucleotidyltransferase domain-containing protein [Cyanobacteria bacterium J06648_16]
MSTSQQQIDEFCQRWKLARLSLFGSVLRDDFGPDSDIDLLYLFVPNHGWDAFDWLHMRAELAKMFGRKVDLVSQKYLKNPYLIKEVTSTEKVLYEKPQD